jgi:hypothetical protein
MVGYGGEEYDSRVEFCYNDIFSPEARRMLVRAVECFFGIERVATGLTRRCQVNPLA